MYVIEDELAFELNRQYLTLSSNLRILTILDLRLTHKIPAIIIAQRLRIPETEISRYTNKFTHDTQIGITHFNQNPQIYYNSRSKALVQRVLRFAEELELRINLRKHQSL